MSNEIPLGLNTPPRPRRVLEPLRATLRDLKQGDVVTATIHKGVYGTFIITGAVRHTLSTSQWVLASWLLNQGDEPATGLLALEVVQRVDEPVPAPRATSDMLGPE